MKEPHTLQEHLEYGEFLERLFAFLDKVYAVEIEYWVDFDLYAENSVEQQKSWGWYREFLDKYIGPGKSFAGLSPEEKKAVFKDWGLLMCSTIIRKKQCLEIINSRSWEVAHDQLMNIFNGKRESGVLIEELKKKGIYKSDQNDTLKTSVLNELREKL